MAVALSKAIQEVALEYNTDSTLPHILHKGIDVLKKLNISFYSHTYSITNYVNPKISLGAGMILQKGGPLVGASKPLKIVLGIKCVSELAGRYEQLDEAYNDLNKAFYGLYPIYRTVEWNLKDQLFPAITIWWMTSVQNYREQTVKVIVCAIRLFKEMYKLSLFLTDLCLLAQNDPMLEFYGYSEFVDDLTNQGAQLANNIELLAEQLTSQEAIGNRLLAKLGMSDTIESLANELGQQHGLLSVIQDQFTRAREDFRSVFERGAVDLSEGMDRPSCLPKSQFIPYIQIQEEVDELFRQQTEEKADKLHEKCADQNQNAWKVNFRRLSKAALSIIDSLNLSPR